MASSAPHLVNRQERVAGGPRVSYSKLLAGYLTLLSLFFFLLAIGEYEDLRAENQKTKEKVCTLAFLSSLPCVKSLDGMVHCSATNFS